MHRRIAQEMTSAVCKIQIKIDVRPSDKEDKDILQKLIETVRTPAQL